MSGITPGYLARRLGLALFTIWLSATIIFIIPRLVPGDPITAMVTRMQLNGGVVEGSARIIATWKQQFGLNDPELVQYGRFLQNAATLNLGYSETQFPSTVQGMVAQALPWTVGLLLMATLISFGLGIVVGAMLAWRRTPLLLRLFLPLTLIFTSIPFYIVGILLIYLFAFVLNWFPTSGAYDAGLTIGLNGAFIGNVIRHGTLPALSIVVTTMGFWALGMRGMMISVEGEDYLILARAKGLSPSRVFFRYSIRNALLPQITALTLGLGGIVGGQILVEFIFGYPGMGYLLYQAILNSDYTVIQGVVFILILATATAVLLLDLLYPFLDPRISYERRR
jgi:peptide/nickel transport system permease protein